MHIRFFALDFLLCMRKCSIEVPNHSNDSPSVSVFLMNYTGLPTMLKSLTAFTSSNPKNGPDLMQMTRTFQMPVHQAWVTGRRKPVRVFSIRYLLLHVIAFSSSKRFLSCRLSITYASMHRPNHDVLLS